MFEKRGNSEGTQNIYVKTLVNQEVQNRIEFILYHLPEANLQWHLRWLLDFAGVEFGKQSESMLLDWVRHIVVNISPSNEVI